MLFRPGRLRAFVQGIVISHKDVKLVVTLYQRLAETGSFQRTSRERVRVAWNKQRTECAAVGAGDSKYEYAKSSADSQGFPFQRLKDSPRIRHASVSCAACPSPATG